MKDTTMIIGYKRYILAVMGSLLLFSCHDLDMAPLSQGTSDTWYKDESEVKAAVSQLYDAKYWTYNGNQEWDTGWDDDIDSRDVVSDLTSGTLTGQSGAVTTVWNNNFQAVTYSNSVINGVEALAAQGITSAELSRYEAEARFFRAHAYGELIFHFGDVPYYTQSLTIEQALDSGRVSKNVILKHIYADLDSAAAALPASYTGAQRITKGAALAMKARIALYEADYVTAAEAAKEVIDLNAYSLEPAYADLFAPNKNTSPEFIFIIPRSFDLKINLYEGRSRIPRTLNGGWNSIYPSWELLAAYTCTDGKTIDKSPLFNPQKPFRNRDPRCTMTIVEFGKPWLGVIYDPSPAAKNVRNLSTGKLIRNLDTRINQQYASYNGLTLRKGVTKRWLETGFNVENPTIVLRYADVLLMYAEAKIELGQIDRSVVEAMDQVRARAYGVDPSDTSAYPAFTLQPQAEMRKQLRIERRMEFPFEGRRFYDLVRWRLMGKVFNRKTYGILYPASEALEKLVYANKWFWPETPVMDENDCADFSKMEEEGYATPIITRKFEDRQYFWPIPTKEVQINSNMKQNEGY